MDFSQPMSKQIPTGERNCSPVPTGIADVIHDFGLTICIYYDGITAKKARQEELRSYPYYCITHLIDGDGFYYDDSVPTKQEISPGQGIIVVPGIKMNYGLLHKYYTEDSICFIGPAADALLKAGIISSGVINIGRERRLLNIINKIRSVSDTAQFEACLLLLQLLIDLHKENKRSLDSNSRQKLDVLLKILKNDITKWWTVNEMAEYCNVSTNYLRRMFREQLNLTPKEYIDRLKMNKACELLSGTDCKIEEIALLLGYKDVYHFIRRFTKLCGISPGKYRKSSLLYISNGIVSQV